MKTGETMNADERCDDEGPLLCDACGKDCRRDCTVSLVGVVLCGDGCSQEVS